MPSTCTFEFDRPEPIYYSGEVINGRIQLQTTSEKSCREIYIQFIGEAKTFWEEEETRIRDDGKTEFYTEYFRGDESYIQSRTNVFPEGKLPPGTHVYTFTIPIPPQAPSSCVEIYGEIKYELSLVINRPFASDNEFHQPLTVLRPLNLNVSPEYAIPLQGEDLKYFCCWPCSSDPVISTLLIPFSGYAPGQKIKFQLHIDNQSIGYDLNGIKFKFKQTYHFKAQTPHHRTRDYTVELAKTTEDQKILSLTKRILEGELLIPPVPPSSQSSAIITIDYFVQMNVRTGCCRTDSKIILPITIGTVPLAQAASSAQTPGWAWMKLTESAETPDYDANQPPNYDLWQPPSYEQAITGKFIGINLKEPSALGFIPKYPMYKNVESPTAPLENDVKEPDAPLLKPPPMAHKIKPSTNGNGSSKMPPYPLGYPSAPPALPYPIEGASTNDSVAEKNPAVEKS